MNQTSLVLLVAVLAVFVLGLYFVTAYRNRGATLSSNTAQRDSADGVSANDAARQLAEAEAESLRQVALAELASLRRTAEAEIQARQRTADAEAASAHASAGRILEQAQRDAEELKAAAQRAAAADDARRSADAELVLRSAHARQAEADQLRSNALDSVERAQTRAEELKAESARLTQLDVELAQAREELRVEAEALDVDRAALTAQSRAHSEELERLAGLTAEQAKAELVAQAEVVARREAASLIRSIEREAQAEGDSRGRVIVAEAVQRVASAQTAESVVAVLPLPSDEMKGRIIGREGRNIRAFESVTGVNVIIDDTPEAVLLSCFDPVRREIGRLTLDKLVSDGRIHPHRIEEAYELSRVEVDELCLRAAQDALLEVGIHDLDDRLLPTLGRLKYRTSYGQNVLSHLTETAHVAGIMAAELGVDPTLVKRGAFLHDIGKALTHEVEGSHAIIGAQLLRKFGENEAVAHAVEAHHNEVHPRTIEAVLTQAADTCSAARPGARRESLEAYVKRLSRIEEIASSRLGVERVFAMQAGREVRVMVQPSAVDDLEASILAREIAKQIEDELTYPGQIRVTVVRESRVTEVAH